MANTTKSLERSKPSHEKEEKSLEQLLAELRKGGEIDWESLADKDVRRSPR